MKRALGSIALLLVAGLLAACTAAAPNMGPAPTPTAQQMAALQTTESPPSPPTATAALPTATSTPPTATARPVAPAEPTPAPSTADTEADSGKIAFGAQDGSRLPPPPDPGTGRSEVIPDPTTLVHPIFGDDPNELQVALTFDAGADTGYTAEILDLLAAEGIKASFGMTGLWAELNPDLVRRMVDEGHMLFNHTWDHASLTGANTGQPPQTAEEVAKQLADTEAVVQDLTGYDMKPYFRPPYGDYDATSLGYLADNGYYITVYWTCDSQGWRGWTATQINDYCTVNLKQHEIILLHVGASAGNGTPNSDYAALPGMIASFREQGYAFVTVEEMLQP